MNFTSRSQCAQDKFAYIATNTRNGTYLDIGANNPITINNTFALEELGWDGLLVDNSAESMQACEQQRKAYFYFTDASQPQNWKAALAQAGLPTDRITYLSLDIDSATLACLRCLPLHSLRFSVITAEHDFYRNGPEYRDEMLKIFRDHGYELICGDVMDQGLSFEAWLVDPQVIDMERVARFRRDKPTEWKEFFT